MDIDMQKVRKLRIKMRTMQIAILAIISVYTALCLYFTFFQREVVDYRFVFFLLLPVPFVLRAERRERRDTSPFIVKLNRFLLKEGLYVHEANRTQRFIVQSFFEEKGWEMPLLFTCKAPMANAMIGNIHGTYFLLLTEELYRICSVCDIWAVLAHERGHLVNGDMNWMMAEKILSALSQWVSLILLVKIWGAMMFFPSELVYSLPTYCIIIWCVIAYLWAGVGIFHAELYFIKEILADNTAAQILGSPMPMVECLRSIAVPSAIYVHEREGMLLSVYKKDIPVE